MMASKPRVVVGYHGTTVDEAEKLLAGPLQDSGKVSRWLGQGIYFFEYNVEAATHWASNRAAKAATSAAIIRAEIDLSTCLDLTRSTFQSLVRNAHRTLQAEWKSNPGKQISQKPFELHLGQVRAGYKGDWQDYGRNELDFQVIEKAIELSKLQNNVAYETVRGAFIELGPLYPNSWLFEGAHVAIAVRSPFARVSNLKMFEL
ncbi:hypothetical protein [Bradyrhizobium sp. Gha]|uniref:hypothetical protein n=1 Tax=Bradyrhizobium sp. Gha TaxID=1855318 RepID=UPI0008F06818|nr:hypothetical protein [Bradyrhizobium sp. Gha]SFK19338.1 hypothetical protein SAMN05216525_16114 [Bradyrhizobium sp. Gha]